MSEMNQGDRRRGGRALPVVEPAFPRPEAPTPPAERRDAAENRRQILAATQRLFAARGVDAVSMDEIARAAGVGKGTLYRRYAHKGLLCQALLDANARRFQEEVLAQVRREELPALAGLDCFLARLAAFNEENGALLGAVHDAACGARRGEIYRSPAYDWQRLIVATLLRRAVAVGECPAVDVDYLADAILAPLDIDLYLFQRHARGFTPDRITEGLRRLVFAGLRPGE